MLEQYTELCGLKNRIQISPCLTPEPWTFSGLCINIGSRYPLGCLLTPSAPTQQTTCDSCITTVSICQVDYTKNNNYQQFSFFLKPIRICVTLVHSKTHS